MSTSSSANTRPWWARTGCLISALVVVLIVGGALVALFYSYQGREISRWTGIPQRVALPDCITSPDQVLSVSFHKDNTGETVKDVTYVCDGRIYSHEYNDFGILQGSIEWTYKRPQGAAPPSEPAK